MNPAAVNAQKHGALAYKNCIARPDKTAAKLAIRPPLCAIKHMRSLHAVCGTRAYYIALCFAAIAWVSRRAKYAVAALPKGMGGMGMVDLPSYVQALQAKVVAMLLHPKVQPWKALMRGAIAAGFPGRGLRVVLHRPRGIQRPHSVSVRQMAALQAFWGLPVVRLVSHERMSWHQIRVEGLVGNPSVCRADGTAFSTALALPAAARGGIIEREGALPAEVWQEMVLPPPWRERLSGVEVSEWELSADGSGARRLQGGEWAYFEVLPSGRVEPADAPVQAAGAAPPPVWRPACVVPVPVEGARGAVSHYVLGPWSRVEVDPGVWAVGKCPLLESPGLSSKGNLLDTAQYTLHKNLTQYT